MRAILAATIFCLFSALRPFPASAGWIMDVEKAGVHRSVAYADEGWHAPRLIVHAAHVALSAPCRIARALGGPCGCVASERVFGHSVRALWSVSAWVHDFPRVAPAPGMAAIWPERHVEIVETVNRDRTVTTSGPYGIRRVRIAGLIFVDPHRSRGN